MKNPDRKRPKNRRTPVERKHWWRDIRHMIFHSKHDQQMREKK